MKMACRFVSLLNGIIWKIVLKIINNHQKNNSKEIKELVLLINNKDLHLNNKKKLEKKKKLSPMIRNYNKKKC